MSRHTTIRRPYVSPGHQRVVVGIRNRNTDYKLVPSNRPSKQCKRVLGGLEQTLATLKVKASSGASVKIG